MADADVDGMSEQSRALVAKLTAELHALDEAREVIAERLARLTCGARGSPLAASAVAIRVFVVRALEERGGPMITRDITRYVLQRAPQTPPERIKNVVTIGARTGLLSHDGGPPGARLYALPPPRR